MEAIRLKIEAEYDEKILLDKLVVARGEEKFPLVFKKMNTEKNGNEIMITGTRPNGHTMMTLGEDTYDAVKEISGVHRMKFRGEDGRLASPKVKKVAIVFPYKKGEEVVIYKRE